MHSMMTPDDFPEGLAPEMLRVPLPEHPAFPPELWGTIASHLEEPDNARVRGALYRAPEGLVVSLHCTQCATRWERLLTAPADLLPGNPGILLATLAPLVAQVKTEARVFTDDHRDCTAESQAMDEDLARLAELIKRDVEHSLAAGQDPLFATFIQVKGLDGMLIIPTPPFTREDKYRHIAELQYLVRQVRKVAPVTGVASVTLGWARESHMAGDLEEGPRPSEAPDRREVAIVSLANQVTCHTLTGLVDRHGDPRTAEGQRDDVGPGSVHSWAIHPGGSNRLMDGMFADPPVPV
jgi:hypothetical protein